MLMVNRLRRIDVGKAVTRGSRDRSTDHHLLERDARTRHHPHCTGALHRLAVPAGSQLTGHVIISDHLGRASRRCRTACCTSARVDACQRRGERPNLRGLENEAGLTISRLELNCAHAIWAEEDQHLITDLKLTTKLSLLRQIQNMELPFLVSNDHRSRNTGCYGDNFSLNGRKR